MTGRIWTLALLGLIAAPWPAPADEPRARSAEKPPTFTLSRWDAPTFPSVLLQDPFSTINSVAPEDIEREQGAAKEPPKHIRDNAFLVEEAFNQEKGDAQHIFNWIN